MSRYRKYWVAIAGTLAQLLVALEAALDVGAIPQAWRPWLAVVLALATALGVRRVPNAPMPLSTTRLDEFSALLRDHRRDDGGHSSLRTLWGTLAALAAAAALVATTAVLGAPAEAHAPRPTVAITSARDDVAGAGDAWTKIAFTARKGRTWLLDDGTASLQVYDVSGRSVSPLGEGSWQTFRMFGEDGVPDDEDLLVSGGEGHLRFNETGYTRQGGHPLFYRVLFRGGRSPAVDVDAELGYGQ